MHQFIIISLLALSMVGCRHAPQTANDAALQMWRSSHSSLQQRADAVNNLVPSGTKIEDVERVLGRKGTWKRFRGPMPNDNINHRRFPDYDYWRFVYEFPGGGVALQFESSTVFGDRFWCASPVPVSTRFEPRAPSTNN
jgi:hypothetical protein